MLHFYSRKSIVTLSLLCMLLCCGLGVAIAQDTAPLRTGIVLDNYGNPIKDVRVMVKGQDSVKVSDGEGYFAITAPDQSTLIFSHPDFNELEMKVEPGKFIAIESADASQRRVVSAYVNVKLSERYLKDPAKLDVLYGTTDKSSMLGSAATVYTNQLNTTPGNTIAYALPGRLAGLYTEQFRGARNPQTTVNYDVNIFLGNIPKTGLGAPSDNSEFGLSLRGQSPVTVIDGVQRDIFSLDPESIESVSVQKDALSSLLLGMRSSRGVLLITTKKAKAEGFRLSFSGQVGVQTSLNTPDPLPAYQYAYLMNEALQNDGKAPIYTEADFAAFKNGTDPIGHPDVNWYNATLRKSSPISSYNINASGGGKVARYSVSMSYMNQKGMFQTSPDNSYNTNLGLSRYVINSRIDLNVTDNFEVGVSLFGRVQEGTQPGGATGMNSVLSGIQNTPNNAYPIRNPNNSFGGNVSFTNNLMAQTMYSGYTQDNGRDAMANVDLKYDLHDFVKGLTIKGTTNISTQSLAAIVRSKQNAVFEYNPNGNQGEGSYTQYGTPVPQSNSFVLVSGSRFWYGQLSLNYDQTFGKHGIGAMLFGDKRVVTVNFDLPQRPTNLAGKINYNYDKKYFAEAAIDYSKYNGYPPGHQWGTFYAFGAGYDISREAFLKDVTWLNLLKLRAVYGRTGSGIDNTGYYTWRQTYATTVQDGTYPQGYSRGTGNGITENVPLANPNLTWEKADKLDVGVDVSLFKNHFQITGDYYHDTYFDLLQQRGKSIALMGFTYPSENIGKDLYKGVELSLTYQNRVGNFNYFVTGNWSRMETEVLFMDEQYRQNDYNKRTGGPTQAIYGLVADGFFNSTTEIQNSAVIPGIAVQPGDIKYKDLNGDHVIDQYDQTAIGNTKPLAFYGLTAGFSFKGFDVSVLLQGAYNRDIYVANGDMQAGFQAVGQSYGQAYAPMLGRWTPETAATATYPRLTAGSNANNMPALANTSFWVKSGDYMRVKNVSIGYTLPFKWTGRINVSEVKLFVNGQNLFTHAAYDQVDPEVTNFTNYPLQRVVSGGVSIKL